MKYFGSGLSELHKELSSVIYDRSKWNDARRLFLDLHSKLHLASASDTGANEVDELIGDLTPGEYRVMATSKDETIAWVIWHISRIEDLTMNILVAESDQLFDDKWRASLDASISDTGNALNDGEIMELSRRVNIENLLKYRNAVGRKTREIVASLSADDMRRNVSARGLDIIRRTGGVTDQPESLWLLDYWGKKDVAGLLLMPPTRHLIMHLNDCGKWKQQIRSGKKCYLTV